MWQAGAQGAEFGLQVMWIMVDVRCVQMHNVEVVVMSAHAHTAMGNTAMFTTIACLL
jgi:hypothetical protein